MKKMIEQVSANVRLQEGARMIEQLLIDCYLNPGISTKELARKLLLPVPVTAAIKRELIKAGLLEQVNGVYCTLEGTAYVENECGYDGLNKALYQKLMKGDVDWRSELADVLSTLGELFECRPQVNVQIDQSQCTAETSIARAILCLREQALIGKRVLCVGDDDMVSVSLGFLLKRLFTNGRNHKVKIVVIDIDDRFLRYISEIADREGLPIQCHHSDLRQPLIEELHGRYDCFFTDPPYTMQGASLFISRGISALKKEKGLPIFFSFAHKSPDFMLAMQRELVRMGLMVREMIPNFNKYEGAEIIGNRSQMMILKTTEHTSPDIIDTFEDALYTGEVRQTLRRYRCKQCDESVLVGFQGEVPTIEDLKNRGCAYCQNNTFDLLEKRMI